MIFFSLFQLRRVWVFVAILLMSLSQGAYAEPNRNDSQLSQWIQWKFWHASFVQLTHSPLLEDYIKKSGKIWIETPDSIKIDFHGDWENVYLMRGNQLEVYTKTEKSRTTEVDTRKLLSPEILAVLRAPDSLGQFFLVQPAIHADFPEWIHHDSIESKDWEWWSLIPRKKASRLRQVALGFDRLGRLRRLFVVPKDGNSTSYAFENHKQQSGSLDELNREKIFTLP